MLRNLSSLQEGPDKTVLYHCFCAYRSLQLEASILSIGNGSYVSRDDNQATALPYHGVISSGPEQYGMK